MTVSPTATGTSTYHWLTCTEASSAMLRFASCATAKEAGTWQDM